MGNNKWKISAIVLAAGQGKRMESNIPKQYLLLNEKPILYYSLKAFEDNEQIDEIVVVTGEGEEDYCKKNIIEKYSFRKVKKIIKGGKERYNSVYEGLCVLENCDYVLIHDGARPFLNQDIINRTVEEVIKEQAVVVGVPAKDTIKIADQMEYAVETPDRNMVWQIQTPQAFGYKLIRESYDRLLASDVQKITDDAMVIEETTNRRVKLIKGSYKNIKITTPEDLIIANAFLSSEYFE